VDHVTVPHAPVRRGFPPKPEGCGTIVVLCGSHQGGDALWERICALGLEGVVAKKRSGHYLPGRRGWIKTKNQEY
jgi:ATP-dependent DNA ligase